MKARLSLCLTTLLLASLVMPANARDLLLEEVTVTAQKREQNALDVPVTIDTFSSSDLENTGALVIEDIAAYIPGLETGDGVTQNTLKIRGVENSNISSGQDPSVASFFDEVYLPAAAITVSFSDIAQIEVLKGPQGTLFGRNAALGVVNMIPNQPDMEERSGFVALKLAEYGTRRFEAMYNLPLADNFALRVNYLANRRDTLLDNEAGPLTEENPISSPDPRKADNVAARIALKWDTTDRLSMQFAYDYDDVDNGAKDSQGLGPNSDFPDPADRKIGQDALNPGETREMYSVIYKLWYDISDSMSMKFITSYRPYETYNRQDEDGTSSRFYLDTNNVFDSDIFYNELQFNMSTSIAELVFGLNYSQEDVYQLTEATASDDVVIAAVGAGGLGPADLLVGAVAGAAIEPFETETLTNTGEFQNYGVYFDADFTITDRLNILGGLRYSYDDKTFTFFTPENTGNAAAANGGNLIFPATNGVEEGSKSWSAVTGRLVANYQITEGAMAFGTFSTGYKSGGFDSLNIVTKDDPLDPEIVENIEVGVKGDFFNTTLRTQFSYFYTTIDGRQEVLESLRPGDTAARPTIVNADETIEGFELTVDWLPWETLRFGLVYTQRENERDREPYFDNTGEFRSNDNASATAPKDFTITADYSHNFLADSQIFYHFDYIFQDNIARDSEDHQEVFNTFPGYADDTELVNLRVAWVSAGSKYEVALFGQNLLDDTSYNSQDGIPTGLIAGITGDYVTFIQKPRIFGMDLKYSF